ncbi:ABC transporter ATP-binding protein [Candidatus Contubernalis alkaliaceticus]|uniref:ABC transporter ATP-binding protein n=1 Tax=Candidatus Contubernalis alkaliaceticus TaxID=338645 RepID=UPI001F4BE6F5|nr:ABC transporter ATP-binding protein [Candidatus Contubernalis alkalaceticus]UNC91807.1 ABC transporter ATP-binding protein [Candidatus Contubernalis alkalaceticus]
MDVLKKLLKLLLPYRNWVAVSFIAALFVMAANLIIPQLIRVVIDQVALEKQMNLLYLIAVGVVGVHLIKAVFIFLQRYSMEFVAQKVIFDLRNKLYSHLQRLSLSYLGKISTGQLMSRVTSDVETLRRFLDFGVIHFLQSFLTIVGILTVMLFMHPQLALVSLASIPFLIITVGKFARRVKPAFSEIQQDVAQLSSVLQENIAGIRLVQTNTREEGEAKKFREQNKKLFLSNVFTAKLWSFYLPLMHFVSGLGTALIFWYGGRLVISGQLLLGELIAFNSYLLLLVMPLRMLGWIISLIQRAVSSGERIFEILDSQPEIRDLPDALTLEEVKGSVEFNGVSFGYEENKLVLKDINLQVAPGQVTALVGATGCGKSAMVELIPRFYDTQQGTILLDGRDIKSITLKSLRKNIGIVFQESFLFSASLAENIAFGKPHASEDEIIKAAKAAQIHDFIDSLPQGYQTVIGERGLGLSGGQKQRISIARTLLVDPQILILDDITANIDAGTEYLVRKALSVLMKGKTVFMVAQRLSSLKSADRIVVLDQGEIVEQGSHHELIQAGGRYAQIYKMQYYGLEPSAS